MSEPDARYYQVHGDDPDEWGEPAGEPTKASSRRLASMISVRFSPEEAREVRAAAAEAGASVSNFVRTAALQRSRESRADASMSLASPTPAASFAEVATRTCPGPEMSTVTEGVFVIGHPEFEPKFEPKFSPAA